MIRFWFGICLTFGLTLRAGEVDLLLLNERGRSEPVKLADGTAPLGLMVWSHPSKGIVSYCQAFHVVTPKQRRFLFTAKHCLQREMEKLQLTVYYYSNRDDRLEHLVIDESTAIHLHVPVSEKEKSYSYAYDLAAIPLERSAAANWDTLALFSRRKTPSGPNHNFRYGGYRLPLAEDVLDYRSKFEWHRCKGEHGVSPRVKASWVRDDIRFEQSYFLSYSKQSVSQDEALGLFLWECNVFDGGSGGLVLNADSEPIGILIAVIATDTVKRTWEATLAGRFERTLRTEQKQEVAAGQLTFQAASGERFKKKFSLEDREALYAVAISMQSWEKNLPALLEQLEP